MIKQIAISLAAVSLSVTWCHAEPTTSTSLATVCVGPECVASREAAGIPHQAEGLAVFLAKLFDTADYPSRWHCGQWASDVGWLHIISDFAIFAAYLAIPIVLLYFLLRRRDLPLLGVFWLFAAFILLCGFGHLIEAAIFWWPAYRFAGLVKAITAVISWATVCALFRVIPQALVLPGLAVLNEQLEAEIAERSVTQRRLQESFDELQQFADNALDREDRVIELKEEVNELLTELGREAKYALQGDTA